MRTFAPGWLPASATIDLRLLLAGRKPVVRLHVGERRLELRRWARRHGLFACTDRDGYVALSRSGTSARRVLDLDRRPGRHTVALGLMLGYPICCSRAAARVGDEGIDRLHASIAARRFRGRFATIDPGGYLDGSAAVSHVPCSSNCVASLGAALAHSRC
jgi:hypothetical protein